MPREPISDDVRQAQSLGRVAVRAADGRTLALCHPARARALVRRGPARLIRRHPPLIRLKDPGTKA
jgi:hypothetical protein